MADAVRGQARGSTKGQVLVVDDERPVARVFGRVLETAGYQTSVCYDGAMALSLLDRYEYDVVLSDLAMPGLDGIELLRAVRARDLDLPVILVTGTPSMDSAILAVEYGAHRYLQKPVDARLLSEAVSKAISVRRFAVLRREMLAALGAQGLCLSDRAGLEVRFERALEHLYMVFQPVVSWSARSVFAYEAFVRSREPTLRTPRELFDAAERLNRLYELTSRIHDLCGERLGTLPPLALLLVNLHVQDLTYASKLVETSALVPVADRVVLELTERAALEQVHDMQSKVAMYRQAGFRIALDDIGAGYAGLNSFTLLDPDIVKLDNVLVRDVDGAPTKRRLVASMPKLCADLGMHVVAEGIEAEREREVLVGLGCDVVPGLLCALPAGTLVAAIFAE